MSASHCNGPAAVGHTPTLTAPQRKPLFERHGAFADAGAKLPQPACASDEVARPRDRSWCCTFGPTRPSDQSAACRRPHHHQLVYPPRSASVPTAPGCRPTHRVRAAGAERVRRRRSAGLFRQGSHRRDYQRRCLLLAAVEYERSWWCRRISRVRSRLRACYLPLLAACEQAAPSVARPFPEGCRFVHAHL